MMILSSTNELNKILRQVLITQSELDEERVLNALSLYGTELDKYLSDSIYESVDQNDTTLLFSLEARNSTSDVSIVNENEVDNITYYKAFKLSLIIYGDNSNDTGIKLAARFRSENVRTQLYDKGIYVEEVTDPTILNEFKNDTIWIRTDLDINIGVEFNITPVNTDFDFENLTELKIIQKGEK